MKTRILIVDGYAPFRSNLGQFLLSLGAGYEVVGEAASDDCAMEQVRHLQPNIALVALYLPDRSGLVTARVIHRGWPQTSVIVISDHPDAEYRRAALAAGAFAYVDKPSLVSKLPRVLAEAVARRSATEAGNPTGTAPDLPLQP